MLSILQGDDTAVNNRGIRIVIPRGVDLPTGWFFEFDLLGLRKRLVGSNPRGGTVDYTAAETGAFPLGVFYGRLWIVTGEGEGAMRQTVSHSVPVRVTDSVAEAYGGENAVDIRLVINTGVPPIDIDEVGTKDNVGAVKAALNALIRALRGAN